MVTHFVMLAPQETKRGDSYDAMPAGTQCAVEFSEGSQVVLKVLKEVERRDDIDGTVSDGQDQSVSLQKPDSLSNRKAQSIPIAVDTYYPETLPEKFEHSSRARADIKVQESTPPQPGFLEQASQDTAPGPKPPVSPFEGPVLSVVMALHGEASFLGALLARLGETALPVFGHHVLVKTADTNFEARPGNPGKIRLHHRPERETSRLLCAERGRGGNYLRLVFGGNAGKRTDDLRHRRRLLGRQYLHATRSMLGTVALPYPGKKTASHLDGAVIDVKVVPDRIKRDVDVDRSPIDQTPRYP